MDLDNTHSHKEGDDYEEHGFSEELIHQAIETIEFVLGSISNTASYLRLWALSLAHSQLASVFLKMILKPFLVGNNPVFLDVIFTCIAFVMFLLITLGVILLMDFMECFLHALRLHWVEYQNKFFKGTGYLFEAFSFQKYLSVKFGETHK